MDATAKLIAIVALAAFATERILAAVNYVMNAVRLSRVRPGAGLRLRAKERRKLVLTILGGIIAAVVVDRADLRILRTMQLGDVNPLVDLWLTWLIVFAGADRVGSFLSPDAAASKEDAPAVRVQIDDGEIRELKRVG
jgi:hypothetical protein